MERRIILDFISQNFNQLKQIDFKQIFIYQFGKNYDLNSLEGNILNGENLFAYEINLPRINSKILPFEKIDSELFEFALTIKEITILSCKGLNFDLFEVYNDKNIKEIKFNYLYLQPIYVDKKLVGVISMYANELIKEFSFNKASLTVLFNQLEQVDQFILKNHLTSTLIEIDDYYFILKHADNNKVFLSNTLKDKWKLTKNSVDFNHDLVRKFLSHHLIKEKKLKFPYESYKIFYLLKEVYDDITSNYLHINAINKLNLPNEFTLIVVLWNEQREFCEITEGVNFGSEYYLSAYEQDYYLLLICRKYSASFVNRILKKYDCQYLILNAPGDINNKMDLNRIMEYIKNSRCEKFVYSEYIIYFNNLSQEGMKVILRNKNRLIVNSKDSNQQLILLNYVPNDLSYQVILEEFENRTLQKANNFIKNHSDDFAICLDSLSLLKRKFTELLKKCKTKQIRLTLIIDYNKLSKKDELIEAITIVKNYNVKIYATSSIFLNLNLIDTMRYFDGCYVTKEEFTSIQSSPNEFMNMFVSYYFNGNKHIIFEETTNIEYNKRYEDELIFFVKESENKE